MGPSRRQLLPRPATHHKVRTRRILALTALATVGAVVASCANDLDRSETPTPGGGLDVQLVAALAPFDGCKDLLSYIHTEAAAAVGPYGLDGIAVGIAREDSMTTLGGQATPSAAAPNEAGTDARQSADDGATKTTETTNNQETGVDEADIVKADGNRVVTVRNNELIIVTLTEGAPYLTSRVALGENFSGSDLFLLDDRAYVMGYENSTSGTTRSAVVEVSLGGTPAVSDRVVIEGNLLDGRLANGTLRLVTTTPGATGLGFVYPSDGTRKAEELAETTNRKLVENSDLSDWVPNRIDADGSRHQLIDCDQLYRPVEPSGFSMLSILTISDGLSSLTASGVLADGQITYASSEHLYVATNAWADLSKDTGAQPISAEHTDVHSFAIDGTAPANYEASGRLDGHVLNQYSMSEADGNLRIATTSNPQWFGGPCPPNARCASPMPVVESEVSDDPGTADGTVSSDDTVSSEPVTPPAASVGESRIVILGREGQELKELGSVGGLGKTEQIKSVRYVGETAYVVTFRQTDPFYVVDLSKPSKPRILGELKVPGFSSYLHPVGDHLVLGVGSDATDQGRISGAKLSLYDTSDPVKPKEISTYISRTMNFMAGDDPHAFTWDAERATALLPFYAGCFDTIEMSSDCSMTNGVLAVKVADGKITELGTIDHTDRTASPVVAPTTTTTTTTTTTVAPTTTTTAAPSTTTTVPDTTVPETTEPDTTTTSTAPERATTGASKSEEPGSSPSSPPSSGSDGPAIDQPMPIDPGIGCDPAACDPGFQAAPTITRAFFLGDRIITLSDFGIAAHDAATLKSSGFAAF